MVFKRISVGRRLQYFRKQNNLTQEQLGLMVGFPPDSAGIRVAQYECDSRQPKADLRNGFAKVLGVSENALNAPKISNAEELMHLLFALEDVYGIVPLMLYGSDEKLNAIIAAWDDKFEQLDAGRITQREYNNWRWNFHLSESGALGDDLHERFDESLREAHLAVHDLARVVNEIKEHYVQNQCE